MNRCDVEYRQSSNKRLLVELTLIEIAQITQKDDDPVAGRSPRRLKILFKNIIEKVQPKPVQQVTGASRTKTQKTEQLEQAQQVQPKLSLGTIGMSF